MSAYWRPPLIIRSDSLLHRRAYVFATVLSLLSRESRSFGAGDTPHPLPSRPRLKGDEPPLPVWTDVSAPGLQVTGLRFGGGSPYIAVFDHVPAGFRCSKTAAGTHERATHARCLLRICRGIGLVVAAAFPPFLTPPFLCAVLVCVVTT